MQHTIKCLLWACPKQHSRPNPCKTPCPPNRRKTKRAHRQMALKEMEAHTAEQTHFYGSADNARPVRHCFSINNSTHHHKHHNPTKTSHPTQAVRLTPAKARLSHNPQRSTLPISPQTHNEKPQQPMATLLDDCIVPKVLQEALSVSRVQRLCVKTLPAADIQVQILI